MDPAAYARHHGVQSETNKVTVTRVACGELVYKRNVDTYRRHMQAQVNSIRREQNRLRRCIRGYRKKLRGNQRAPRNARVVKPANFEPTNPSPFSSSKAQSESKTPSSKYEDYRLPPEEVSVLHVLRKPLPKDAAGVTDTSDTGADVAQQEQSDCRDDESTDEEDDGQFFILEDVGRIARKGSGKIGLASRPKDVLDDNEDGAIDDISLLSDSSEDEEDPKEEEDIVDIVSFKKGRLVREITPFSLIRKGNSAYLKPILPIHKNEAVNRIKDRKRPNNRKTHKTEHASEGEKLHENVPDIDSSGENSHSSNPTALPLTGTKTDEISTGSHTKPREETFIHILERKKRTVRKKTVGVSFGDLMKLQHGNSTKKLFSFVDRLAELNGITAEKEEPKSFANDPRVSVAIKRRARISADLEQNGLPQNNTTYGSVFYAMKFGYVSEPELTPVRKERLRHQTSKGKLFTGTLAQSVSRAGLSDTSSTRRRSPVNSDDFIVLPTMSLSERSPGLRGKAADSIESKKLKRSDVDEKPPNLSAGSSESPDGSSVFENNSLKHDPLESKRRMREARKGSLLETSKYISEIRSRNGMVGNPLRRPSQHHPAQLDREYLQKKRASIKPQPDALSAHQQAVSESIVPWSSAFRRIKLVHTLVDFSNII